MSRSEVTRASSISDSRDSESGSYQPMFEDDFGYGDGARTGDMRDTIEEYDPARDSVLRAELEQEREKALKVWSLRAGVFAFLQILPAIVMLIQNSYVSTTLNGLIIVSGIVGARSRRHEYALLYFVANCLNIIKDIVMMAIYPWPWFGYVVFIVDLVLFTPGGLYVSFYLYQSRRLLLIHEAH